MEDEKKEELELEPEILETEEVKEEEEKDTDFDNKLKELEKGDKKTEAEKATRSLHFNAERVKELGLDPAEILGLKPKAEDKDVDSLIESKFAERDARGRAKSDSEFNLIMWYVRNKGLPVNEAWILANQGKILRSQSEADRARVEFSKEEGGGRKIDTITVPARSSEEIKVLERRGYRFNPKTKTYQGKFYEDVWDGTQWISRKLQKS